MSTHLKFIHIRLIRIYSEGNWMYSGNFFEKQSFSIVIIFGLFEKSQMDFIKIVLDNILLVSAKSGRYKRRTKTIQTQEI